jgi:hypothetical protein
MSAPYDPEYYGRFQNLVDGLVEKTRAATNSGTPMWDQVGEDTYELSLTRSTIRISSRDADGQRPYLFELIDEKGRPVETIEDEGMGATHVRLGDLYHIVTQGKKYKAVNDALTDVLTELDIPDYEPPPF